MEGYHRVSWRFVIKCINKQKINYQIKYRRTIGKSAFKWFCFNLSTCFAIWIGFVFFFCKGTTANNTWSFRTLKRMIRTKLFFTAHPAIYCVLFTPFKCTQRHGKMSLQSLETSRKLKIFLLYFIYICLI